MQHKYEITFESNDPTSHVLRVLGDNVSQAFGDNHIVALHTEPLPTEPGLYTVAKNPRDVTRFRIFACSELGNWSEFGDPDNQLPSIHDENNRCVAMIQQYNWRLTRLVPES